MAKVIKISDPVNEAERAAIRHLRDALPASYTVVHNFEITRHDERFEIDLAIIAPHAVYLVDVKGTHGLIDVSGPKWYPEGRRAFTSPLLKLRGHAKTLKGLITDANPGRQELGKIYVDAVILLTAPNATLHDPAGVDAGDVTSLKASAKFFADTARITPRFSKNIGPMMNMVMKALTGIAKKRQGAIQFGNWIVDERISATDIYTEYRAHHALTGASAGATRLRVYQADPYLPEEQREAQRKRISTAFTALSTMGSHPHIIGVRDFLETEGEDGYVLVTDDVPGHALRLHIDKPALALTLDQKHRVARQVLLALKHAHSHGVIHRNLTPADLLLGTDGQARIAGFDFARVGDDRSFTIAEQIVDDLDEAYMAPEVNREPEAATASSDVFSLGLILYELFTGERPFGSHTEIFDQEAYFAQAPSSLRSELTKQHDAWLQGLCIFDPGQRHSADWGLRQLEAILAASTATAATPPPPSANETGPKAPLPAPLDYSKLKQGDQLGSKYVVEGVLGKPGAFGVVYKVIDTFGDVPRAIKLILRDRHSTLERLKKEYRTLLSVPEHPHVVKVYDADVIPGGGPPCIVFEFVDGFDVGEMIAESALSPEDAYELALSVLSGLVHLHAHGAYHCDIKPRNLIWTAKGAKIIDFNVSVLAANDDGHGGGSRRYLPPDLDLSVYPQPSDLCDRDCYALGLTLYEAITGRFPWESAVPPAGKPAPDPREITGYQDLTGELASVVLKAIAPKRADRFATAADFLKALQGVPDVRRKQGSEDSSAWLAMLAGDGVDQSGGSDASTALPPNSNPFVQYLTTLYSQSTHSNAGTRGLDHLGKQIYVETALDRELAPAILDGQLRLVVITGNAGDGKTAFLQQLETQAEAAGATLDHSIGNGCQFEIKGRSYRSNYDGSQDEGEEQSDDVLRAFFEPFSGASSEAWPRDQVRLIAINEGRLIDFLDKHHQSFAALRDVLEEGLRSGQPIDGTAVVNLNLRSVVADNQQAGGSIFKRLMARITAQRFWSPCQGCDLRDKCYAHHNACSFQDDTAGPKLVERLETLYAVTHMRERMHITLRDLRSALAFMLTSGRSCQEIHDLYATGDRGQIAAGFYFNSWMGGDGDHADRLLKLLREVDVATIGDPNLDRQISFISPVQNKQLFNFTQRAGYDRDILQKLFADLPRHAANSMTREDVDRHQSYVAINRRRSFFERRDAGWKQMLPYRNADSFLRIMTGEQAPEPLLAGIIAAINRGEGLRNPKALPHALAIQVRQVAKGTVRSYRLFSAEDFALRMNGGHGNSPYLEHLPSSLTLAYQGSGESSAELTINLDVFEMLQRLQQGYFPSIEEEQGYYVNLSVFKNTLGSAQYQEVLLTTSGHDFYRIERQPDGRLTMQHAQTGVD